MLKQRVITALVLLAVLLPCLFAPAPTPFALLTLLFVTAAMWEWARLNQVGSALMVLGGAVTLLGGCWAIWSSVLLSPNAVVVPSTFWLVGAIAWGLGAILMLSQGARWWSTIPAAIRELIGLAILIMAWLALTRAKVQGINFLLSVMCLVWAADIGAYFGGRAWGRHKLAVSISPGKTWEGVYCGAAAALVLAGCWLVAERTWSLGSASVYQRLHAQWGMAGLVLGVLLLVAMSVAGDLIESLVKRQAGAKDSSQLLPGHGGVLDRVDALLPVFPVAMALVNLPHGQ